MNSITGRKPTMAAPIPRPGETVLADRRIDDAPFAKAIEQTLAHFVGAVVLRHFLAHEEDVRVALQFFRERFVQRLAIGNLSHAFASDSPFT